MTNNFAMGALIALAAGMRTCGLLLTLLVASAKAATDQQPVVPQGTIITAAQVTGFDVDRLSPGLREDIRNLAGTPLTQGPLDALAARIEAERPQYVAAVRAVMDPDGQARVFFVVGRQEVRERDDNINARYIVESVAIEDVPETYVSQSLRDDLRALVGDRLDPDEADKLHDRLEAELPGYDVKRRIRRGSQRGRIRVVFEVREGEGLRLIRFRPSRSKIVFHSDLGWSGVLDIPIGGPRNNRLTLGVVAGNDDD
ncbi:MAG: hypothetical protein ACRD2A_00080, partial [Vicinamibacterales bacterium]